MSNITRFIPKAERIKSALADEARQIVFDLQLPEQATEDILYRTTASRNRGRTGKLDI